MIRANPRRPRLGCRARDTVPAMKPGRASETAVLVCMARAAANGRTSVSAFSDPTALALLPDSARSRVERFRSGVRPTGARERFKWDALDRRAKMMVARTVAVDDAVRAAGSPQLVILGAGLDGRAWRLPELRDVVVFEVDHPDSQREKRARTAELERVAREVHFVPVDFTRDSLDDALEAAGHDPARPTTWVWEGVVMYLSMPDIEKTLAVIQRRSAARSRVVVVYHSPAIILWLIGLIVRRLGEPLRSEITADEMRSLLARYGFVVTEDRDLPTIGASLAPDVAKATKVMKHGRVAVADTAAAG